MNTRDQNRNQLILFFGLLVSTAGTYLLLIQLSATVFKQTQSSLLSSLVFAAQWLLPIFWQGRIVIELQRFKLKRKLIFFEIASGVISLVIGSGFALPILICLLVIRGLFELGTKSTRIQATKHYFDGPQLTRFSSLTQLGQVLGIGLGAVLSFIFADKLSLIEVACIDSVTFIVAACLYTCLPVDKDVLARKQAAKSATAFGSHLKLSILRLALVTAVFQGIHNVLRVTLPMVYLKMNSAGVGLTQICFISGVAAGAAVTSYFQDSPFLRRSTLFLSLAFGCLLVASNLAANIPAALFFYFLMALCFEILFLRYFNEALKISSPADIAEVSAALAVWPSAAMSIAVPLFGVSIDALGPNQVILGTVCLFVVIWLLMGRWDEEKEVSNR